MHLDSSAPNEISISDWEAVLPVHGAKSWIRGTSYTATAYSKPGEAADKASMLNLIDRAGFFSPHIFGRTTLS